MSVTEHEKTLEVIRNEYIELIRKWLNDDLENGCKNYTTISEQNLFETMTILQMRSLYIRIRFSDKDSPITIIGINPSDPYLAISQNGMYIGIEPDGYTHS